VHIEGRNGLFCGAGQNFFHLQVFLFQVFVIFEKVEMKLFPEFWSARFFRRGEADELRNESRGIEQGKERTMKVWMAPMLVAMFWWPAWQSEWGWHEGAAHDLYLFESADERALAVVSPDPWSVDDAEGAPRRWQAEVHVRVGPDSVTDVVVFDAERIKPDTVAFVETAWGRELHVTATATEGAVQQRWRIGAEGLQEVMPSGWVH
jgi:hypothetical protein